MSARPLAGRRGASNVAIVGLRATHMLAALKAGPMSSADLVRVLGWPEAWVGACISRLRQHGDVVLLVQRRPERISNGRGFKTLKRKLYSLPTGAPFEPWEKLDRAPRSKGLGPSVAPLSHRNGRPRTQSGSGVIAPPPYHRGMVWGAGW